MLFLVYLILLFLFPYQVIPMSLLYIVIQFNRYFKILLSEEMNNRIINDEDPKEIAKSYFKYSVFFRLALYHAICNIKEELNKKQDFKNDTSDCVSFFDLQNIKIIDKDIINKQFKKLAKKYHPDANINLGKKEREKCSTNFKKLVQCKERLLKGL